MELDWQKLEFYHYLAFAGLAVVLLAVILYFVLGKKLVVPAIVTCGIGCFVAGVAIGVISLAAFGYELKPPTQSNTAGADNEGGGGRGPAGPPGGMGMGGRGGPGGMGMGGPGGGGRGGPGGGGMGMAAVGGGGRAQSPKRQLVNLVEKLELVANKPITVELTDEQRKQVLEQLKGLKEIEDLKEDEAKKRLDALLEVLEKHKETLQTVGFRWPGAGGGGPGGGGPGGFGGGGFGGGGGGFGGGGPQDAPNPFKEEKDAKVLNALESRLGGKPASK
jgi:hypothetical protein